MPIRTESGVRRAPFVNYILIGVNMALFLLLDERLFGEGIRNLKEQYLALDSSDPKLYQFIAYAFLHADVWHLFGNMLFLWVFGNSVNGKMGDWAYLVFYLAGGVFAGWGWAVLNPGPTYLVGASGAIAAVTTAYLVLFPRSRVTVLVWFFFFIRFFELSALVIILLKIILWDNVVAPSIGPPGNVATSAHLAGYLFGFVGALGMLFVRAIPRDQFDILALWRRWNLRREFASAMAKPEAEVRARYGSAARVAAPTPEQQAQEERQLDDIAKLRGRIGRALERGDAAAAGGGYEELVTLDPRQCLPEQQQLQVAREFYGAGRFALAAAAFERFVEAYSRSPEAANIRLLLGIIYTRDLQQHEVADEYLTKSLATLRDEARRTQCLEWLGNVRAVLGRPAPQG
ncbi:MAG: rhomboid family intramembrane serine protease [Planctomycetes bacterium]|nr:rhomboid family intramembrane serine protease [Planctomycetota bacterium]